jgi:hypothetical protein
VNLLIYLVDHLLRGCQSADNQFQALQNQTTKDYSVYGSQLPEIEAEAAQTQLFIRISLRHLLFSGSARFSSLSIFVHLFWATSRLFSIIPNCFGF